MRHFPAAGHESGTGFEGFAARSLEAAELCGEGFEYRGGDGCVAAVGLDSSWEGAGVPLRGAALLSGLSARVSDRRARQLSARRGRFAL